MRLLTDEHIAKDVFDFLSSEGHDVVAVSAIMAGATDLAVFQYAKKERRVIVTLDADFGNILRFPLTDHAGILLLRTRNVQPSIIKELLRSVFVRLSEERIKGRLVVVSHARIRIYPHF